MLLSSYVVTQVIGLLCISLWPANVIVGLCLWVWYIANAVVGLCLWVWYFVVAINTPFFENNLVLKVIGNTQLVP